MPVFEFKAYPADENGKTPAEPETSVAYYKFDSSARSAAGMMAKRINGPVDLAFAGRGEWADRYITTANPSDYTAKGFSFERLT